MVVDLCCTRSFFKGFFKHGQLRTTQQKVLVFFDALCNSFERVWHMENLSRRKEIVSFVAQAPTHAAQVWFRPFLQNDAWHWCQPGFGVFGFWWPVFKRMNVLLVFVCVLLLVNSLLFKNQQTAHTGNHYIGVQNNKMFVKEERNSTFLIVENYKQNIPRLSSKWPLRTY